LIYQDEDKSLGNLDRIIMHRFRKTLNHLEVKEVRLNGRKYTWSNRQANLTMSRIDRAFSSVEWEQWYPKPYLQALTSSTSDHYSLLPSPLDNPALNLDLDLSPFGLQCQDSLILSPKLGIGVFIQVSTLSTPCILS
jgi:hypothetical protein